MNGLNDKTPEDLEKFQHFLYRNFKNHPKYSDMRPVSNQLARFFAFTFAEIIKNDVLDLKEEYVSYDFESLVTSIPVKETIDYIITEIYDNKLIEPMCKIKLIFRRLLEKLTQNCVFSVNNKLVKQVDGCPMGGTISVICLAFI